MPRTTIAPVTMSSALITELARRHERSRPCSGQLAGEGRDKRRAHRAFGEQVADEVGDAAGDAETRRWRRRRRSNTPGPDREPARECGS